MTKTLHYTPAHPTISFPGEGMWMITDQSGWIWAYFESHPITEGWRAMSRMDPMPTGNRRLYGVFHDEDVAAIADNPDLPALPVVNTLTSDG